MKRVLLPNTLSEALEALHRHPEARIYAGGTDLLVSLRAGPADPAVLICIERIEKLKGIEVRDGRLRIGAGTTHSELLDDRRVGDRLPGLTAAVATIGSPMIRNMGTIGGNICTASPAGDSLPPLVAMGARLELQSHRETRWLYLTDFITGPGQTALRSDELLTAVEVPTDEGFNLQRYEKVGRRQALACAVVSLAALLKVDPAGTIRRVRLAWGSVGPTVVRAPEVEAALLDRTLEHRTLAAAAERVSAAVDPIDDVRAGADYRRTVAANLLFRLLPATRGAP